MNISVYTFEDRYGVSFTDWHTQNYAEARAYAEQYRLRLIENEYVWEDSQLLEDYSPHSFYSFDFETGVGPEDRSETFEVDEAEAAEAFAREHKLRLWLNDGEGNAECVADFEAEER